MRRGFTLIELSIVLVVIGLVAGGVLVGQSLIRASELNAVTSDLQRFQTAITTFHDKYLALPGDMSTATTIWPSAVNGNGNGQLDFAAGANATGEAFEFWKQLALAGLVEGKYNGLSGPAGARDAVIGTNVPASRIGKAGYSIEWIGEMSADLYRWDGSYGNALYAGTQIANEPTEGNSFAPKEVWNIDTKIDDGQPATGNIRPYRKNARPNCTTTDVEATTAYSLLNSTTACNLVFITGN